MMHQTVQGMDAVSPYARSTVRTWTGAPRGTGSDMGGLHSYTACKLASWVIGSLYATNLYGNSRFTVSLLQTVHQLTGDRHASRQNIAGQRFGDVEGLAVRPAERAVVQVMMVGTCLLYTSDAADE